MAIIDQDGHIKLANFGNAIILKDLEHYTPDSSDVIFSSNYLGILYIIKDTI